MHLDLDLKLKENLFDVHSNSSNIDFKVNFTYEDQVEPNPFEMFLSSLASCIGVFAYKYPV